MGDNATGGMEQTGGMCCAASIAPKDRDYTVCITAMDEGIFIGMYRAETDDDCDPDDWREIGEIGTTVTDNDGDDVLIADESSRRTRHSTHATPPCRHSSPTKVWRYSTRRSRPAVGSPLTPSSTTARTAPINHLASRPGGGSGCGVLLPSPLSPHH